MSQNVAIVNLHIFNSLITVLLKKRKKIASKKKKKKCPGRDSNPGLKLFFKPNALTT